MRSLRRLLALLFAVAMLTVAAPARALEPAYTAGHGQFSGGPRFGSDNLGFGLGVRGGYTLDNNIYLGGSFDYFFGDSDDFRNIAGVGIRNSYHLWTLSFEGGYDFHIADRLVVRPFAGLGVIGVNGETCSYPARACSEYDDTDVIFTLGGVLHYFVAERIFIGPDLRLLIHDDAALVLGGHVGIAF